MHTTFSLHIPDSIANAQFVLTPDWSYRVLFAILKLTVQEITQERQTFVHFDCVKTDWLMSLRGHLILKVKIPC